MKRSTPFPKNFPATDQHNAQMVNDHGSDGENAIPVSDSTRHLGATHRKNNRNRSPKNAFSPVINRSENFRKLLLARKDSDNDSTGAVLDPESAQATSKKNAWRRNTPNRKPKHGKHDEEQNIVTSAPIHSLPTRDANVTDHETVAIDTLGDNKSRPINFAEDDDAGYLHFVCRTARSVSDLQHVEMTATGAAYTDSDGQTALHVLCRNPHLSNTSAGLRITASHSSSSSPSSIPPTISSASEEWGIQNDCSQERLVHFLLKLLWSYPAAMLTTDGRGHIPFENVLREWIDSIYESAPVKTNSRRSILNGSGSTILPPWLVTPSLQPITNVASNFVAGSRGWISGYQRHSQFAMGKDVEKGDRNTPVGHAESPQHVRLSSQALFAMKMLSAIVENMEKATSIFANKSSYLSSCRQNLRNRTRQKLMLKELHNSTVLDLRDSIVDSIASVPELMKMILLLEDGKERTMCLETSIIRRVLINKHSVGRWLTGMLSSQEKRAKTLAMEYLSLVSELATDKSNVETKVTLLPKSRRKIVGAERLGNLEEFCLEISRLDDFVPSLLTLGDEEIEDVATTLVVQKVLDQIISRPFIVSVVFLDGLFLACLLSGYRGAVSSLLLGRSPATILRCIYFSNVGLFYFLIRDIGKMSTIRSFSCYLLNFWNLTDLASTILALSSTIFMRYAMSRSNYSTTIPDSISGIRTFCAITTAFMWLRVLNYLKGVNVQLATFVLALLQITKDVAWFILILLLLVVSFAQMFWTLLVPYECASDEPTEQGSKECSQAEYYLMVYAILLGDFGLFGRDNFTSAFSVFLACFYTFIVVLLCLNTIIAASGDSYDRCMIRNQKLFGRARVLMLAELVSFQKLLRTRRPKKHSDNDQTTASNGRGSAIFYASSLCLVVIWTIGEVVGYLTGPQQSTVLAASLGSVCVNVSLFAFIMLFLSPNAVKDEELHEESSNGRQAFYSLYFQKAMMHLLGSSRANRDPTDYQWQGRLLYLRDELESVLQSRLDELATENSNQHDALRKSLEEMLRT